MLFKMARIHEIKHRTYKKKKLKCFRFMKQSNLIIRSSLILSSSSALSLSILCEPRPIQPSGPLLHCSSLSLSLSLYPSKLSRNKEKTTSLIGSQTTAFLGPCHNITFHMYPSDCLFSHRAPFSSCLVRLV